MHRCARWAALAVLSVMAARGEAAFADERLELGGFFGPRVFSKDAQLGNVPGVEDTLSTGVVIGARVSWPFLRWLWIEAELPITTTTTRQYDTDVFWMELRGQARFVMIASGPVRPYLLGGSGMPVVLSSKRGIFASGVTGEAYGGGGVQLITKGGLALRVDVRVGFQPGVGAAIEPELEVDAGLSFPLGKSDAEKRRDRLPPPPPSDRDGDGIPDAVDKCPDRAEDKDGFEDDDGCPDIDNDGDEVLDIADNCPLQPETFNGFEDDDGCPDTVPDDVDAIRGTVEGLLYNPGEVEVRASAARALDRIAATMIKHPSIKVLATGYTDDREAAPARPAEGADPAAATAAASIDLAQRRADAVKAELVRRGVQPTHVDVIARGVEDPVDSNDTPRGRLHNRRVEVKFFVPQRSAK